MERAYALRDARERERNIAVQQKYDAQWRDACDDARTLDSKAMTLYMNQERLRQIEEKKNRKGDLSDQENAFLAEWTRQADALAARDEAKRNLKKQIDCETSAAVKAQIERNAKLKEDFMAQKLEEERADLEKVCIVFLLLFFYFPYL
jgi:cilia- and flagella-associated protein 53